MQGHLTLESYPHYSYFLYHWNSFDNRDETILDLHWVFFHTGNSGLTWPNKQSRQDWETKFTTAFITPAMKVSRCGYKHPPQIMKHSSSPHV